MSKSPKPTGDLPVIAVRLKEAREAAGLSQADLAERVGMKQTGIGSIEAGESARPRKLLELARAVSRSPHWLLGEEDDMATLHTKIHQHVAAGSTLHTDEAGVYRGLGGLFFNHETVNHSEGEYVRKGVTTNSVESVFAVMKRGLIGVYHHASKKHLGRYVDEFAFRLNDGRVQRHTLERLESFVGGTKGKRLTYKALIQ